MLILLSQAADYVELADTNFFHMLNLPLSMGYQKETI